LYRGIKDFKNGYQPRTYVVEDEKGDFVTDSHSILAKWRNHFSQLLNIYGVSEVRHTEIHTAEPIVPNPSTFAFGMDFEKLKRHIPPSIGQFQAEWLKQWVEQIALRSINLSILFGIRKNCLKGGRSRSLYLFIRRVIKQIVVITGAYHFCQLCTKFYPTSCCQS